MRRQEGVRTAVFELSAVGIENDCLPVSGDRLIALFIFFQRDSEIVVGLRVVGLERNRLPISIDRRIESSLCAQGIAEIEISLGVGWILSDCRLIRPCALSATPRLP